MSETPPMVSVIITTYRMPDYVNQAVASVCRQTLTDVEVIVVDDASGEETVRQYDFPGNVRLICHPERRGSAAATRNTGIRASRGRYIAFLDHDDIWFPEKLELQVRALEENPEFGLTFCHYTQVDKSLTPLRSQPRPVRRLRNQLSMIIDKCFIRSPSLVLLRREVLEECGLHDESIVGCADRDLWIRLARICRFLPTPEPLVLYRMHPGQLSKQHLTRRDGQLRVMQKNLEWARSERPDLVSTVRRTYARVYRSIARHQIVFEGKPSEGRRSVFQAVSMWPWNPLNYVLFIVSLLYRDAGGDNPDHVGKIG